MFKALLRKQSYVLLSSIFVDRKSGKRRGILGIVGFSLIFIFLFFSIFMMFMGICDAMCQAFVSAGMDWLYFAIIGMMGLCIAVIGSAFMSYSALFQAKDNELLMSMPIPPWAILFTRMLSIWVMGLIFELPAIAAAVVQYCMETGFSARVIVFGLILLLFSSFLVLGLCCLLGWLVAVLMSKVSNKSAATVIFTLVFLGAYYTVYFQIQKILNQIIANGDRIAAVVKSWIYPVYQFGLAASGDGVALVKYCVLCVVVLGIVYYIIAKSFIRIATANRGAVKKEYKAVPQKAESLSKALLRKELTHFVNSPAYLLNGGLGLLALPAMAVVLLIKRNALVPALSQLPDFIPVDELLPVALMAAICLATTTNCITAPSISIEGKTLWISQSLPIDLKLLLAAKERMHLILTCIPAVFPVLAACFVFGLDFQTGVMMAVAVAAFIQFMAALGLALNLKMPVLDWQNETAAVKSSISALICIFGGWVLAVLPVLAAYFISKLGMDIPVQTQLIGWMAVFVLGARLLHNFIYKKGPAILQSL